MRVFISYSSKDKEIVDKLCAYLESRGIGCWVAHRNILPGTEYGREIDEGFKSADAAVYVLSNNSIRSKQVEQEVYMGNDLQAAGFRLFPIFLDELSLSGVFKYVLMSKQAVKWDGINEEELSVLADAILNNGKGTDYDDELGPDASNPLFFKQLLIGIEKYYRINVHKYCDSDINKNLIPRVVDYDKWLDELSALTLSESMKRLWNSHEMSCLYIGKSGCGKTMGLFSLMDEIIKEYSDIPVFFVSIVECETESEHPIVKYIYKKYIKQFNLQITYQELLSLFKTALSRDGHPGLILLLDDISSCRDDAIEMLQEEIDWIKSNSNIQILLSSRTVQHRFLLGNIAVQRFDFQKLDQIQIINYLASQGIEREAGIPLSILTNPLILTLYARTNDFVTKAISDKTCYERNKITSEADVLWNYEEMFAMKFYREEQSPLAQMKYAFFFRFAIPYIAFCMLKSKKTDIGLKMFCRYLTKSTEILQEDIFTDVFEEYFGFEDDIVFSKADEKELFESVMVNQTGFLKKANAGQYEFSKPELLHFFAAVYVYRCLIMHNNDNSKPMEFSEYIFSHEMCRYIGELSGEHLNAPEVDNNGRTILNNGKTFITWAIGKFRNRFDEAGRVGVSNLMQILKIARKKDLTGVDLSYLDLRRVTFSHIVSGHEDIKDVVTKYDGSIIDRWTFRTYGYSRDNVNVIPTKEGILYTNAGTVLCVEPDTGNVKVIAACEGDFVQSIDLNSSRAAVLIAFMNSGICEYDLKTGTKTISVPKDEGVMTGCAKYLGKNYIAYTLRDRKLVLYDYMNDVTRSIIPCNSNTFTIINDYTIIAPSRDRDMYDIDPSTGTIERLYHAETTNCGFITKASVSKNQQYVYASSKDGVFIIWEFDSDEPQKAFELGGDLNSFVVKDEKTVYCLSEKEGIFRLDIDANTFELIGIPFRNTWTAMSLSDDIIVVVSTEGSVVSYNCSDDSFKTIKQESEDHSISFISAWNATFRNLNKQTTMDEKVRTTLVEQNCILDDLH